MPMDGLEQSLAKLRADGAGDAVVAAFRNARRAPAQAGDPGLLREADIEPVADLPDADRLPDAPARTSPGCSTARSSSSSTAASGPAWA